MTMEVTVQNGDLERALKHFNRKIQNDGILKLVRLRKSYEKPCDKRRSKHHRHLLRLNRMRRGRDD